MGADAVLLIAAALDRHELIDFHQLAAELGLDALVEVHDEPELEVALEAGATLDRRQPARPRARSRSTTTGPTRMATAIPAGVVKVAESGVRDAADARRLADAGYDAILVGETLVTAGDPAAALRRPARRSADPAPTPGVDAWCVGRWTEPTTIPGCR